MIFPRILSLLMTVSLTLACASRVTAEPVTIDNGTPILDDNGDFVHAHGGGMIKVGAYYYWFGENRNYNGNDTFFAVSCYRSTNLRDWEFRNHVLRATSASELAFAKIERPKVIYNAATKRFVMWMHKEPGTDYSEARAAVASCATIDGDYTYHGSFRPLLNDVEHMSRDCTLFVDDDGQGYFLTSSNHNQDLRLYRLKPDYLDAAELVKVISPGWARESPCLFKRNGHYFIVGSGTTGWEANQAKYATATNLAGTWTDPTDFGDATTFSSQSAYVLTIQGTGATSYLYIGDRWGRAKGWEVYTGYSRYVFLPLHFPSNSTLTMENAEHVTVDVESGYLASGNAGRDRLDDRSPWIDYSSGWGTWNGNIGQFAGTETTSETVGSTATFSFQGGIVRCYGMRRNDLGIAQILIDGVQVAMVDCYRSNAAGGSLLYESASLPDGPHTLTVRVSGNKNPAASGFEIIVDSFTAPSPKPATNMIDGSARIINRLTGKTVTVSGADPLAENAPLQQFSWGGSGTQVWNFDPLPGGSFTIASQTSEMAQDLNGNYIVQRPVSGAGTQAWELLRTPGGACKFKNVQTGKLADMSESTRSDGGSLIQYTSNNGLNQQWMVLPQRNPSFVREIFIEAETAASQPSFSPFEITAVGATPGGAGITVPAAMGTQNTPSEQGVVSYTFTTDLPFTRARIWVLARVANTSQDDLFFSLDGDSWMTRRLQQHPTDFSWHYCKEARLSAGEHTIQLGWSDSGAVIDKILVQVLDEQPRIIASGIQGEGASRRFWFSWPSTSNDLSYTIEHCTNLGSEPWTAVETGITSTPPMNTYITTTPPGETGFYRIRQE